MAGSASNRIARRLGGPTARRRRHRRVALVVVLLAVLGAGLVVAGSGDDGDEDDEVAVVDDDPVAAACRASNEEIATAQRALLENNEAPGAAEGFLGDAFVDLTRDRAASIRALAPPAEVLAVLDEFDAVIDAIEADPSIGVTSDPFAAVDPRWVELGLHDCQIGGASTVPDE